MKVVDVSIKYSPPSILEYYRYFWII